MELVIGTIVMLVIPLGLVAWRVGQTASWQAVAMVAAATGSLRACVEFIRFCERQ
jgi:hypothetical protein